LFPLELPLSPMRVFAIGIENAFDMSVECSQDPDPCEPSGRLSPPPATALRRHAFRRSELVASEVCYRHSRNADKRVRRAKAPLYVGESGFLIVKMSVGRIDLAMA
jgi:hypothetical protein